MKLKLIREWGGDKQTLFNALLRCRANTIIDDRLAMGCYPFFFIPGDNRQLYVGDDHQYHMGLMSAQHERTEKILYSAYMGELKPAAVGRFAVGLKLRKIDPNIPILPDINFVAFYNHSTSEDAVPGAIHALIESKYITSDAYVSWDNKISVAQDIAKKSPIQLPTRHQPQVVNWQTAMQSAGMTNPGQKWWAPTSESKGLLGDIS